MIGALWIFPRLPTALVSERAQTPGPHKAVAAPGRSVGRWIHVGRPASELRLALLKISRSRAAGGLVADRWGSGTGCEAFAPGRSRFNCKSPAVRAAGEGGLRISSHTPLTPARVSVSACGVQGKERGRVGKRKTLRLRTAPVSVARGRDRSASTGGVVHAAGASCIRQGSERVDRTPQAGFPGSASGGVICPPPAGNPPGGHIFYIFWGAGRLEGGVVACGPNRRAACTAPPSRCTDTRILTFRRRHLPTA